MEKVTTEEELAKAIADNKDTIEIEGDLAQKSIKIKATGKVAWAIAIGAVTVAITAILSASLTSSKSTKTLSSEPMVMSAPPTPETLTTSTIIAIAAIIVAIIGIGVGAFNKMRKYHLEQVSENKVILKRKQTTQT